MKQFVLALVLLFSSQARAVQVLSNWVMPLRLSPRFDLAPFERTKPILLGDILYVGDLQGRVIALHRTLGFVLWETKMPGSISGSFAYGRSKIIVGDRQGNLYGLHARDGSLAWKMKIQGEWLAPAAIVANRVVVVASTGDLYGLNESTGEEIWHYSHRGDEKMTIWGNGGTGVFGNTEIFQGFADGTLVALSAENGRVIWEKRLKTRERFYDIDNTPHVDERRVIAATYDGRVVCLDRLTGNTLWTFPVGSYSGFAVSGSRVYFGGMNHHFYALDIQTGQAVWAQPYEGGTSATPVVVKDSVVFPTSSDPVFLLDVASGKTRAKLTLGAGTLAGAVVAPDSPSFYTLSNYGNLFSYEIRP